MGREIEFKIPISLENFGNVLEKIESNQNFVKMNDVTFKHDAFFSNTNSFNSDGNGKVIRLRKDVVYHDVILPETFDARSEYFIKLFTTSNCESGLQVPNINDVDLHFYLTRKIKRIIDGNEVNVEYENEISDDLYNNIRECFNELGHNPYFFKSKTAVNVVFNQNDPNYHYELVSVNGYIYLECEYVGDNELDNNNLQPLTVMEKMCTDLNLDISTKDTRIWKDIINQ